MFQLGFKPFNNTSCCLFLQYLLKDKRAKALLNEPDKFEDTALHLAASKGFDEIVRVCTV